MDTGAGGWDLSCDVATWLKDKMMPGAVSLKCGAGEKKLLYLP